MNKICEIYVEAQRKEWLRKEVPYKATNNFAEAEGGVFQVNSRPMAVYKVSAETRSENQSLETLSCIKNAIALYFSRFGMDEFSDPRLTGFCRSTTGLRDIEIKVTGVERFYQRARGEHHTRTFNKNGHFVFDRFNGKVQYSEPEKIYPPVSEQNDDSEPSV